MGSEAIKLMKLGRMEGFEKGIKVGEVKVEKAVTSNIVGMLKEGIDVSTISRITKKVEKKF